MAGTLATILGQECYTLIMMALHLSYQSYIFYFQISLM
jgi:hypothetical protein